MFFRSALVLILSAGPALAQVVADPAATVLDTIRADCASLGGTVSMEPGFTRNEDLDGDGRTDLVVNYAAAACSEAASLYCGSGGCMVGFYLARDTGFSELYGDVIRGYDVEPGGVLALDLHGSACDLFGYEACRKRFDVTSGEMVLIEELTGQAAIDAMEAADAAAGGPVTLETAPAEAGKGKGDADQD